MNEEKNKEQKINYIFLIHFEKVLTFSYLFIFLNEMNNFFLTK